MLPAALGTLERESSWSHPELGIPAGRLLLSVGSAVNCPTPRPPAALKGNLGLPETDRGKAACTLVWPYVLEVSWVFSEPVLESYLSCASAGDERGVLMGAACGYLLLGKPKIHVGVLSSIISPSVLYQCLFLKTRSCSSEGVIFLCCRMLKSSVKTGQAKWWRFWQT